MLSLLSIGHGGQHSSGMAQVSYADAMHGEVETCREQFEVLPIGTGFYVRAQLRSKRYERRPCGPERGEERRYVLSGGCPSTAGAICKQPQLVGSRLHGAQIERGGHSSLTFASTAAARSAQQEHGRFSTGTSSSTYCPK